jgi:hypothetical protein
MTDVDYSPSLCQTILNEIVSLLSRYEENMAISPRLENMLSQHLCGNTKVNNFLSICCYGRKGVAVSLHDFNALCILPRTDWRFRLIPKQTSDDLSQVSPLSLEQQERESYIINKFTTTKKTLGLALLDVIQQHPRSLFIRLYLPPDIPNPWWFAILGLKDQSSNFIPPSIVTIRQRIIISINKAMLRKDVFPRFYLFCKESGSFWLSDDGGVGLQQLYLEACSDIYSMLLFN